MRNREDQGYRNPAYIYDEGPTGGGPDSHSASSTSSRSSMKYISTKLKAQGRRRWILLGLIVFLAIVLIIAVTMAIYFTRNKNKGSSLVQAVVNDDSDTTYVSPMTSFTTSESTVSTTVKTTSQATPRTTTRIPTTTEKERQTVTITTEATTTATTWKTSPTTVKTTQPQTTTRTTTTMYTTNRTTTTNATTTSMSASTTEHVTVATEGTTVPTTTPRETNVTSTDNSTAVTTTVPTSNTSGNLSVTMSKILYNPADVKSLTLQCIGRHQGDWKTLTIRRQFKDSYEPVAVVVFNDNNEIEVFKFYPNVTHLVNSGENFVSFSLSFDPFLCSELTNFTCALANEKETATTKANISIFMPEPEIELPHSIVEDKNVIIQCKAEVWGFNGNVVWKFKPEYTHSFMDFSVKPVNNVTQKECSTVIISSLEFSPTMFESGAEFRCELKDYDYHPQVIQKTTNDVTLKVVPSNYCEGKRQFTIHPHPHGPCTLVVYCLDTGPLVYEIECEKGECYDYTKTACVSPENG